jgi:hypothetical protein
MNSHPFRISIALEGPKAGEMKLLVIHDSPGSLKISKELLDMMGEDGDTSDVMPDRIEGTFFCSTAEWLRIKRVSEQQGAEWVQAVSRIGQTFWSCKPKITVLQVMHGSIFSGEDGQIRVIAANGEAKLEGSIDARVAQVTVRDPRPQNGIALRGR